MLVLNRLSTGPTIPELLDAEFESVLAETRNAFRTYTRRARIHFYLKTASLTLAVAGLSLRLGLIDTRSAVKAMGVATRLGRASMTIWRQRRTPCR